MRSNKLCLSKLNLGFRGDGKTCADIDECTEGSDKCVHADCDNSEGSYICKCHSGLIRSFEFE